MWDSLGISKHPQVQNTLSGKKFAKGSHGLYRKHYLLLSMHKYHTYTVCNHYSIHKNVKTLPFIVNTYIQLHLNL